jgi:L-fuculose-phosphate aldolase
MNSTAAVRQTVVDLCVALSRRGHLAGTGGNIALRIDAERIAVTPSATDYLTMTAADVCVLRLADLVLVEGTKPPSVETGLHARVLRARPDVHCSIHTHQPIASACALLGQPLEVPDGPWRQSLGRSVPVVGYAPSGTAWLAALLARALRPDTQAYLMLNHGVLCCGARPEAAVQAVEDLETLACTHLRQRIAARAAREPAQREVFARLDAELAEAIQRATTHPATQNRPAP